MIFEVRVESGSESTEPFLPIEVEAPSWYDAREWARARYGADLIDVVQIPAARLEGHYVAPRATSTAHERHTEHIETVERAAYARGQRDTLASFATLPSNEVMRLAGLR